MGCYCRFLAIPDGSIRDVRDNHLGDLALPLFLPMIQYLYTTSSPFSVFLPQTCPSQTNRPKQTDCSSKPNLNSISSTWRQRVPDLLLWPGKGRQAHRMTNKGHKQGTQTRPGMDKLRTRERHSQKAHTASSHTGSTGCDTMPAKTLAWSTQNRQGHRSCMSSMKQSDAQQEHGPGQGMGQCQVDRQGKGQSKGKGKGKATGTAMGATWG